MEGEEARHEAHEARVEGAATARAETVEAETAEADTAEAVVASAPVEAADGATAWRAVSRMEVLAGEGRDELEGGPRTRRGQERGSRAARAARRRVLARGGGDGKVDGGA